MKRISRFIVGVAILAVACTEDSESPLQPTDALSALQSGVRVTTNADAGPGSFRQAVLQANGDPSTQSLVIRGAGAKLNGSALGDGQSALVADGAEISRSRS